MKPKIGTNRSFGVVFFAVFFIISIWPLFNDGEIRFWSLIISIIFLVLGILNSFLLTPLNKIWFKLGIFLGAIFSPIIMGIIYFFVVTPISFLLKMFNKDILNLKKTKNKTYWKDKDKYNTSMKNQF